MDDPGHPGRSFRRYSERDDEVLAPCAAMAARLVTIPEAELRVVEILLEEIGPDMSRFATAGYLSSWAGPAGRRQPRGRGQATHRADDARGHLSLSSARFP